jgi:hypothetical protein
MNREDNLKEAIDKIFLEEAEANSVSSDFFTENGIKIEDLIGEEEIKLAIEAIEEQEWLNKLIYDSITAKVSNNLPMHIQLHAKIVEHCEETEKHTILEKYNTLLTAYGN